MPKKSDTHLTTELQAALAEAQSLFYAKNSLSLWRGTSSRFISSEKMLADFQMLPKAGQAKLKKLVTATAAVDAMLSEVDSAVRARVKAATKSVLAVYATPIQNKPDWYEFAYAEGLPKQALVRGFDSLYMPRNGKNYCGSIRVSPDGSGSSEPWTFCIVKGRIEIQPDSLY